MSPLRFRISVPVLEPKALRTSFRYEHRAKQSYLPEPIFSRGKLYGTRSRVKVIIQIGPRPKQGNLISNSEIFAKNVAYKEMSVSRTLALLHGLKQLVYDSVTPGKGLKIQNYKLAISHSSIFLNDCIFFIVKILKCFIRVCGKEWKNTRKVVYQNRPNCRKSLSDISEVVTVYCVVSSWRIVSSLVWAYCFNKNPVFIRLVVFQLLRIALIFHHSFFYT